MKRVHRRSASFACALAVTTCTLLAACASGGDDAGGDDAGETADAGLEESDGGVDPRDGGVEGSDAGPLWEGTVRRERSLAWTDAALLDDASATGLARAMGAAASRMDTTPGALMDAWLRRFATTSHSERAGPAQLAGSLGRPIADGGLGADPSTWDLDGAPFKATGVHNRTDLMRSGVVGTDTSHCGELRISFASTDAIVRPFHLLFLFRQPAVAGDVDAGGALTCAATSLRWATLSDLDGAPFLAAARALLDEVITAERFLMIETVELTVSPWEWRQWSPTPPAIVGGAATLENPPLFQQLDIERINAPGILRDDFLAFIAANEAALRARTLELPARFRSPSARVVQGAPWVPLDIGGVGGVAGAEDGALALRRSIEIVGCTACHTADASFVQTRDDRTFSPFYTKELAARARFLDDVMHRRPRTIPFGPLQDDPVLPP